MNTQETQKSLKPGFSRRHFVAAMGAATMTSPLLAQEVQPAAPVINLAGAKVKIGLIGCGGRGQFMANLFRQHGGYEICAVSDYFQAKAEKVGEKLGVSKERCFSGLSGYM